LTAQFDNLSFNVNASGARRTARQFFAEENMHLKRSAIVSLISIFLAALAAAQAPDNANLPDTPAGRAFAAFLTAFNSGNIETMRRFHFERGGDSGNADQDMSFYKQSGGLKLSKVVLSSDYEIDALVKTKKDDRWLRFKMQVGPSSPYPVEDIKVRPASGPDDSRPANEPAAQKDADAQPVPKNMTDAEIAKALADYLDGLAKDDKFSGVALIAKDGKPIFEKAYGFANKAKSVANNTETKFNLGSMNKMFTAVAIAQLAQAGRLSFDDRVGKYLPDYPNKDVASKVTIHHLLTHTSGLGSYWNAKFDQKKATIKSVSDYLSLFADEPLAFEPGNRFQYSNSGFIVLGAIIEKVSGQNYYDYVREHIYKPAGMKNTNAYEMTADTPNLAMGYTTEGPDGEAQGARHENTASRPNKGGPAGGGYSTVEDLLRFHIALRDGKLLNQKYTDLVTTGKVSMGRAKYAYGFGDEIVNGKRIFGHNGGAPGIGSDLSIYPELGYTSVVMTNYDPPLMMPVVRRIREMITQTK
jgi:CubicO group peptidase (beta-lactamase class C family)